MLILAINPSSGKGHARREATKASEYFSNRGINTLLLEGESLQDFRNSFLREIDRDDVTGVIACGGDGLVHELIQHSAPRDIPIGVIPCGTGNDFARSIGVYKLALSQQCDLIVNSEPKSIDLGIVNETWFSAILSTGFDALVNERANLMVWPKGRMKYNLAMIEKIIALRPHHYRIRIDDKELDLPATLITVANGRSYGGGMNICPEASLEDGLFDVMILGEVSRSELLKVFPKVYRGKHVGHPAVTFYRAREIEISGSGSSFADGEPIAKLPLTAKCVSNALRVWAA